MPPIRRSRNLYPLDRLPGFRNGACEDCGTRVASTRDQRRHKKLHLTEDTPENIAIKLPYVCPFVEIGLCDTDRFSEKHSMKVHVESVHYKKRATCPECGLTFADNSSVCRHRKRKHGWVSDRARARNAEDPQPSTTSEEATESEPAPSSKESAAPDEEKEPERGPDEKAKAGVPAYTAQPVMNNTSVNNPDEYVYRFMAACVEETFNAAPASPNHAESLYSASNGAYTASPSSSATSSALPSPTASQFQIDAVYVVPPEQSAPSLNANYTAVPESHVVFDIPQDQSSFYQQQQETSLFQQQQTSFFPQQETSFFPQTEIALFPQQEMRFVPHAKPLFPQEQVPYVSTELSFAPQAEPTPDYFAPEFNSQSSYDAYPDASYDACIENMERFLHGYWVAEAARAFALA
ncbi:hypothetical protein HDZ31DRAFT_71644 [Schizophyllum fasciatum]